MVRLIPEGILRLLGVQLDDQMLLHGDVDVLPGGQAGDVTYGKLRRKMGASWPVRRLNTSEERLFSATSTTSPAFT